MIQSGTQPRTDFGLLVEEAAAIWPFKRGSDGRLYDPNVVSFYLCRLNSHVPKAVNFVLYTVQ